MWAYIQNRAQQKLAMQIYPDWVFLKDGKNISRYDVIDTIQFPMANMAHHEKTCLSLKKKITFSKNESSPYIDNNNKSTSAKIDLSATRLCYFHFLAK